MWTDATMRNESQINAPDYVNNGLSKNNFIGELDPLEILRIEERLNCTESIIISPYFRNEAEKIRDKVKRRYFWIFLYKSVSCKVWAQLDEEGLMRRSTWGGNRSKGRQKRDGYGKKQTKVSLYTFVGIVLKVKRSKQFILECWSLWPSQTRPSVNIIELLNMSDRFPRWL